VQPRSRLVGLAESIIHLPAPKRVPGKNAQILHTGQRECSVGIGAGVWTEPCPASNQPHWLEQQSRLSRTPVVTETRRGSFRSPSAQAPPLRRHRGDGSARNRGALIPHSQRRRILPSHAHRCGHHLKEEAAPGFVMADPRKVILSRGLARTRPGCGASCCWPADNRASQRFEHSGRPRGALDGRR
jgi:hypothetical protein